MASYARNEISVLSRASARLDIVDNGSPQKRLRILYRATERFLDHGFDGTNLDDIAVAAGVGKAAIYQLFGDKTELFAQCLLDAVGVNSALLRDTLRVDLPVEQVLTDFAEQHIVRMFRPVCGSRPYYEFARVLLSASITHPELSRRCLEMLRLEEGTPLHEYFAEVVGAGRLTGAEPDFLTEYFLRAMFFTNHVILDPSYAKEYCDVRAYAKRIVHLFLYGCSPAQQPVAH